MPRQYDEKQLSKLIKSVEEEFTAHLDSLSKSEDSEKRPEDKKDKKDAKAAPAPAKEHAEEHAPEAEHEEHAAPAESEGHEEHAEGHEGEAAPEAEHAEGAEHEEGHDYDEEDMDHMHKMYASMSKAEAKAHHGALKAAMDSHGLACAEIESEHPGHIPGKEAPASLEQDKIAKADGCGGEMAASAPGKTPGAKSADSAAHGEKISKTETGKIEASAPGKTPGAKSADSAAHGEKIMKSEMNPEVELLKSELEAQKAKSDDLKKNLDAVSEFLTKLVKKTAPQGKAITNYDSIAKSEIGSEEKSLSKGEVTAILNKKVADPKLEKKDREAINAFYLENASIDSIRHLLK